MQEEFFTCWWYMGFFICTPFCKLSFTEFATTIFFSNILFQNVRSWYVIGSLCEHWVLCLAKTTFHTICSFYSYDLKHTFGKMYILNLANALKMLFLNWMIPMLGIKNFQKSNLNFPLKENCHFLKPTKQMYFQKVNYKSEITTISYKTENKKVELRNSFPSSYCFLSFTITFLFYQKTFVSRSVILIFFLRKPPNSPLLIWEPEVSTQMNKPSSYLHVFLFNLV